MLYATFAAGLISHVRLTVPTPTRERKLLHPLFAPNGTDESPLSGTFRVAWWLEARDRAARGRWLRAATRPSVVSDSLARLAVHCIHGPLRGDSGALPATGPRHMPRTERSSSPTGLGAPGQRASLHRVRENKGNTVRLREVPGKRLVTPPLMVAKNGGRRLVPVRYQVPGGWWGRRGLGLSGPGR